jgi:hypothetical protein
MLSSSRDTDFLILENLEGEDLKNFCLVNKYFSQIFKDEEFWKKRTIKKFYFLSFEKYKINKWKDIYFRLFSTLNLFYEGIKNHDKIFIEKTKELKDEFIERIFTVDYEKTKELTENIKNEMSIKESLDIFFKDEFIFPNLLINTMFETYDFSKSQVKEMLLYLFESKDQRIRLNDDFLKYLYLEEDFEDLFSFFLSHPKIDKIKFLKYFINSSLRYNKNFSSLLKFIPLENIKEISSLYIDRLLAYQTVAFKYILNHLKENGISEFSTETLRFTF